MSKTAAASAVLATSLVVYAASATLVPIALLRMIASMGFGLADGGALETGRVLLLFVCLFISGLLARRFGLARILSLGAALLVLSCVIFFLSKSYSSLMMAMMMAGFGGGLLEALITPMIARLHPEDDGSIMNRFHGYFSLGVAVTVLLGGVLLSVRFPWRWLFVLLAPPAMFTAWGFHRLHRLDRSQEKAEVHLPRLEVLRRPTFWAFGMAIMFGGAAESAFNYWAPSLLQLRYQLLPVFGGVGTACFALGMGLARIRGQWLISRVGLVRQIRYSALAGGVVTLLLFWSPNVWWMLPMLFVAGMCTGCYWPSIQALAVKKIAGDSTFIFIALSCCGILGYAAVPPVIGWLAERTSLTWAFLLLPPIFWGILGSLWLAGRKR